MKRELQLRQIVLHVPCFSILFCTHLTMPVPDSRDTGRIEDDENYEDHSRSAMPNLRTLRGHLIKATTHPIVICKVIVPGCLGFWLIVLEK
ncbi:hypothetical protein C5167_024921 [Papaver somniferum]|uniref:Uncharacterized protein n=1 Tax=Papaver somniferum TaxID=3469 RepID=A0A4Y7JPX3_PAPSO|nr:hypothetical protein C5167_024921 [Papaver somniferum]